ncbi:MAG: PTS sugar transporter subunit IIA [Geobacter sp.]|nr:PTS sugar transporter subunit IIA [Geobacter sp.]
MKGALVLKPADVIMDLQATKGEEVLAELADRLVQGSPAVSREVLLQLLHDREGLGSTGIGDGIAIPHCKLPELKEPVLLFGRSFNGVDFRAIDGRPVHLFFLLAAPEGAAGIHLKLLARLSRLLKDSAVRERLMTARTPDEITAIVVERDSIA